MSYARFGWEGSDVFVYISVGDFLTCGGCIRDADPMTPFAEEMAAHLRWHISLGDCVPDGVIEEILADGDVEPEETLIERERQGQ